MNIDSAAILHRLALHLQLKNDGVAVAQFLGVNSSQVIYNWRARNNIDLLLVVPKVKQADPSINLNWLIYGEGPERRPLEEQKPERHPTEIVGAHTGTNVITTNETFTLEDFSAFIAERRRRNAGHDTATEGGSSLAQ